MSSRHGGGPPRIHKTAIPAVFLVLALAGCQNTAVPPDYGSSTGDVSLISDSGDNTSSEFSDSASSAVSSSSTQSEISSSSVSNESSSNESSGSSSLSASSSSASSSTSSSYTSSSSSISSSTSSSTSSSSNPPTVVIPDIVVPTSPGTAVFTASGIVLDYSNASNGYVSVKYTGSAERVKFRYNCSGKEYTFDVITNGAAQYFPLSCGSGTYTFSVFEKIEGNSYSTPIQQTVGISVTNDIKPYTYSNSYVYYSKSSNCVQKAAELCAGKTSDIDKISAIFLYISSNISYDYQLAATVKGGYIPNPDKTLSSKKGICFDYASLMAAMLRSQGIPTRLVIGYASPDIYHAWNEIYTEETGWITPELLMNKRGYNIVDATFYASAADKVTISNYIMNSTNYSAVYYY